MAIADQLAVSILGDIANLSAGMNKATAQVGAFGKRVEKIGKSVASAGKKMTMALTLPLVAFGAMAVKFGSDAEEIQSKFNAVFKQTAGVVTDWIDEFAGQVGRSKTALKDYAATFQDTFVPLGFVREEAAKLSTRLVELTIDLASFNNASEPETMRALQSAIVGNHETVRRFGVIINQAGLNIELMNMGIKDGAKAATEAEKAQARLNLIIRGTTDAQGDAIRTSGSFANVVKALKADFRDLFEEISKFLIPILVKIIEKIRTAIGWFKDLDVDTQRLIVRLGLVAAALGPILLLTGKLITAIRALSLALTTFSSHPFILAITAIIAELIYLYATIEKVRIYVNEVLAITLKTFTDWTNWIIWLMNQLVNAINLLIYTINLIPGIKIPGLAAIGYVDFSKAIGDASRTVAGALDDGLGGIATDIETGLDDVGTDVANALDVVSTPLKDRMEETNEFLQGIGIDISKQLEKIGENTEEGLKEIADVLGKGRLGEATAELVRMQTNLVSIDAGIKENTVERRLALIEQAAATAGYAQAEIAYLAEMQRGSEVGIELSKRLLDDAKARLDIARSEYSRLDASLATEQERAESLEAKIEEQRKLVEAAQIGIGDMLDVNIAGFFDLKASFDRGLEALKFTIGDMELAFDRSMADIKIKIGDLTISLTKALGLLGTDLLAVLLPLLGPIALIGVGMLILVALTKNIAKVGEYIKAILTMIFTPFIIIAKFLAGIVQFFTGKSAEAGAAAIPVMQAGGIVPGLPGVPRPMIGHGGEPFGAAGFAKVIDYRMIGEAVAAGVYDAMMEVLSKDRGRPIVLNIDGKRAAQALFQPFLLEQERRGGEALFT